MISNYSGASRNHGAVWRIARAALMGVFALSVAGCSIFSPDKPGPPCPPILVLKDAAALTRFVPGPGRDITDVSFTGRLSDFRAECKFKKDLSEVEIKMNVVFVLNRGASNKDRKASFEYFVALPLFHPQPQGKKIFTKAGEFQGNRARLGIVEDVTLVIPLARGTKRDDYKIFLGFQLSEEEIERNRKRNQF
jgi:hypothetical protein